MKRKSLVASILTIALCLSLIAGSTFALFTSTSTVNVAVTSGKVDVVATIDQNSVYLGTSLENGNLAETRCELSENGNTIKLDKMVPGDYLEFNLVIKNNSNVTVLYRTVVKKVADNGLWNGLEVEIGGTTYDGATKIADWEELAPESAEITVPVKLTLPEEAGNEYQEKTCEFSYTVEAVQGNATVTNPTVTDGQTALNEALSAAGDTVDLYLEAGTYTMPVVTNKAVTITGDENAVIDMTASSIIGAQNANLDITFDGMTIKFADAFDYKGITHSAKVTYKNCVLYGNQVMYAGEVEFIDCTFVNYSDYAVWTYGAGTVTFDSCTFYTGGKAILVYAEQWVDSQIVDVKNCTFNATKTAQTSAGDDCAAIEIDGSLITGTYTVDIGGTNNLATHFNGISRIKSQKDPANVTVNNNGTTVNVDATSVYTDNAGIVAEVLKSNTKTIDVTLTGDVEITADSGTQWTNASGGAATETITIDGQGKYTLTFKHPDSDANHVATNGAELVLKNLNLTNSGYNNGPWNRHDIVFDCKVTLENVTSDTAIALGGTATMKNVTINETGDVYALWIKASVSTVELDNVTINCPDGRAIAIKDEYVAESNRVAVQLNIKDSKIVSAKKAAILVTNTAGATINASNVDISGVTKDTTNLVWVDNNPNYQNLTDVTVSGCTAIVEP